MKVKSVRIEETGLKVILDDYKGNTLKTNLLPRYKDTNELLLPNGNHILDETAKEAIEAMILDDDEICGVYNANKINEGIIRNDVIERMINNLAEENYSIGSKVENPEYTKEEKEMMNEELKKWKQDPNYIIKINEFTTEEFKVLRELAQLEIEKKKHVFEKILKEYKKRFMEIKKGRPTEIYLTKDMKWELCNTLTDRYPGDLKDKILVEGPIVAFPTILGMKVIWDAEEFEIK